MHICAEGFGNTFTEFCVEELVYLNAMLNFIALISLHIWHSCGPLLADCLCLLQQLCGKVLLFTLLPSAALSLP